MVRSALACPYTVVSIILLKAMHFLGYSSNCVRVLDDGVSEVFEIASVSSDRTLVHDMEDPSSMALNSVVRICAIAFWGLIKLGVYQLCLLAMVFLVDILMFPKSPLIGGEMNVQIRFRVLKKRNLEGLISGKRDFKLTQPPSFVLLDYLYEIDVCTFGVSALQHFRRL